MIGQIIGGLIVGILARLLLPGKEAFPDGPLGWLLTAVLGIVGCYCRRHYRTNVVGRGQLRGRLDNVDTGSDNSASSSPACDGKPDDNHDVTLFKFKNAMPGPSGPGIRILWIRKRGSCTAGMSAIARYFNDILIHRVLAVVAAIARVSHGLTAA